MDTINRTFTPFVFIICISIFEFIVFHGESIICRATTTTLPDDTSMAYINSRCASGDTYWDHNYDLSQTKPETIQKYKYKSLGQLAPFGMLLVLIIFMIPLLIFDHLRLAKILDIIKFPHVVEKIEMMTIRLLRSHFETTTSCISTSDELINISCRSESRPRYLTYSFGKTLFKTYLIINTIHIVIQTVLIIQISIFLDFKIDLTNSISIDNGILPHRVICMLFSNNIGEQNIDIYQCTLPLQYRIGRTFTVLILYTIMITSGNLICLLRSLCSFLSRSDRQKTWIPYCQAQSVMHLDDIQTKHFVDYIDCDGHYLLTILRKHMSNIDFQQFFELFIQTTFTETDLE